VIHPLIKQIGLNFGSATDAAVAIKKLNMLRL